MAKYLTQKMSYGILKAITYYKKQKTDHPSHDETGAFTQQAINAYATTNNIQANQVEVGTFHNNQGVPTGGLTEELY